jgi:puromycin-sensitive aminopeptidase
VTTTPSDDRYRLPRTVVPHRYTLALEPDLDAATFVGHVVIDCVASAAAGSVVLNAAELQIESVRVAGREVAFSTDEEAERLTLQQPVDEGPLAIEITFAGTLNDKLRGWYRSTFTDDSGQTHVIATSQMQATDCRRAFPCFDEPDFKAVFDITLVVEPQLLAVSNGPEVERSAHEGGKIAVRFAPTMPMSTYLVAVVVGPLEATDAVHVPRLGGGTIPLRVIHVPGKAHLTDYALEVGRFALTWFQEYYDIAYPTDKCDMLALPDFAAGAMENLGCITFREYLLLADPEVATQFDLQNIADVITHELAHMWFGDLVTMRWWNGIWLNEAFATFMEVACCAAFRPDWLRWTSFSLERSMAFEVDSLASTRSVEYPVLAPADCDGMFDVLTYQKGGSLLRMLEQYLGAEQFRQGVAHYLRVHSYANTETSDLWDAIEQANHTAPVRKLMDSWIWQPGYPLVRARLDGASVVITQQRFAFGDTEDPTLFVVPLHVTVDGVESKLLLDGYETRVALPSADSTVVVNAGGHGFLRVDYDDALRGRLTGAAIETLTVIDRYNLVDDAWNAVVAGRLAAADFLAFVEGFAAERDLAVWQAIAAGLRGVGRLVGGDAYAAMQRRVAELVSPVLADIGWDPAEGESDLRAKLRGLLVTMLAVQGNDHDAQQRCRAILTAGEGADPELIAASISSVAAVGTAADYEDYLARWRTAATPQDQQRYLYSLGEFPGATEIERTIELAFSDEVRTQNAPFLLARCLANRWQGALAWQRLRGRWAEANERFPNNTISRMIDPVKLLTSPEVVADVQGFFAEHDIPQAAKTLQQVLERQRVNAAVAEREADRLAASLAG